MLVPTRIQAEVFEHLQIFFHRLVQRGEIVADHQRAGAGHENHALRVAQVHRAPAGNHDFLSRQNEPETRDGLQNFQGGQGRVLRKRRAGNRVEDIDGHDIRADFPERKGEVAAVLARFAHADDAAGTNLNAGLFEIADGFKAVVVGVRGAGLREKTARTFEIMTVALNAGLLEPVGHPLTFDDAERDIGPRFAARLQFPHPLADFVQHWPFVQPFPSGDEANGGDAVPVRFVSGFANRFRVNEAIFRRTGLVKRRLRTEAAIFRARPGFGVDDRAKMDFVAFELFADAIGPGQQIQNVGRRFKIEEPERVVAGNVPAGQNTFAEFGEPEVIFSVNRFSRHG